MGHSFIKTFLFAFSLSTVVVDGSAQQKLYPQTFDLQEVQLLDGPFKRAMELNDDVLLQYDVDRLLTPYFRQAGLSGWEAMHPNFENWGSGSFRLDGHVGGHYLSALALAYAASDDAAMRARLLERLEYTVQMMDSCQRVFDNNTQGLYGYIGGLPDNSVWTKMYSGDLSGFNNNRGNVPFYTVHKMYAGFRDAWLYAGNEQARVCFLKLCDWGINLIGNLSESTMQEVLRTEHGGMNEVYADAYQMTGDAKYLAAAQRYSQTSMVNGMQSVSPTFLNSMHANTQVPKYVGFARVAQQDGLGTSSATRYGAAAKNFWTDVVKNRTVAFGGNSVDEHFLTQSNCANYIHNPNGPESCNTHNMMKLSENLFACTHDADYADFYEQAMYNHILSTQHPETGGYVYFTPLRPQHYRMYSQVNEAMWCCVGTGMENHSKYGAFVYTHSPENDTLFVNLFVPSRLKSDAFCVLQETKFPYEQSSVLTVKKAGNYTLAVRRPSWCAEEFGLTVNGSAQSLTVMQGEADYVYLARQWKVGDKIEVSLPMRIMVEPCPNYTDYVALRYGPILLAAVTSRENLAGQHAGAGRMDHCPSLGTQMSLLSAPMLIGERSSVPDSVYVVDADNLHFKIRGGLYNSSRWEELTLQPFFTVHEARYMMYWNQVTPEVWERIRAEVEAEEAIAQALENRTLDKISTGEQQSDAGHSREGTFGTGNYSGEFYIDAAKGNWFSYQLETKGVRENVSLMCRYTLADVGRSATIYVDGEKLRDVTLTQSGNGFYNVEYPLSEGMLTKGDGTVKDTITVKFEASGSTPTPGVYYLRLLKDYKSVPHYSFVCTQWVSGDANRVNSVSYDKEANSLRVYGKSGQHNIALQLDRGYSDSTVIDCDEKLLLVKGKTLNPVSSASNLWWLNGMNKGTSVQPTYRVQDSDGSLLVVWDIRESGLDGNMQTDPVVLSAYGADIMTVFGLTSSQADYSATITDINFYRPQDAVDRYPVLAQALGLTPSRIDAPSVDGALKGTFSLDGKRIPEEKEDHLDRGIYVREGRKVLVK